MGEQDEEQQYTECVTESEMQQSSDYKVKAILKMLWMNTSLIWMTFIFTIITLVCVLVNNIAAQIIGFLLIGLLGTLMWQKWDKQIKKLIQ